MTAKYDRNDVFNKKSKHYNSSAPLKQEDGNYTVAARIPEPKREWLRRMTQGKKK